MSAAVTPPPPRLGERLLDDGLLRASQLESHLRDQAEVGCHLGELLVARGAVAESAVWKSLASAWDVPWMEMTLDTVDPATALLLDPITSVESGVLPFKESGGLIWIAAIDPSDGAVRATVSREITRPLLWFAATPSSLRKVQAALFDHALGEAAVATLRSAHPDASAERQLTGRQVAFGLGGFGLLLIALVLWRGAAMVAVMGAVVIFYAVWLAYRTWVIVNGARTRSGETVDATEARGLKDLPVYTVLCPLYHEGSVVEQLVRQIESIDYPSVKLDVKLLVEAGDRETKAVLDSIDLPPCCEVLVVPDMAPQTKPKACNYGLQFARGEFVVIFDAEDRPEPDQLRKALGLFRRHQDSPGRPVGCVQARLAYYNARQNWLTGWFALEYLSWFDFFLPGLVKLGLPVPLGGSSNHFPTSVLRQMGCWDAFNVTEDADLGIRLHRAGYRTVIVDSVTWEEANSDFVNWTKQRSRWGKGYFVTWAVNMRRPVRLWRELGARAWLSVQMTLAGTYLTAVLNLLLWGLMVVWILGQPTAVASLFPSGIYYLAMLELLLGNFFFLYVTLWCATESGAFGLTRLALSYPAYWVMMSVAMVKASLQLLTDHVYWEKTIHGLTPPSGGPPTAGRPPDPKLADLSPRLEPVPVRHLARALKPGGGHSRRRGLRWIAPGLTVGLTAAVAAVTWAGMAATSNAALRARLDQAQPPAAASVSPALAGQVGPDSKITSLDTGAKGRGLMHPLGGDS
ncbi:MAG: glycosyltransferase [Candidatus Dormiibacterota bacterium]